MLHKKIENCFMREYSERSWIISKAVVQRSSVKKAFSEILQNSQENTCAWVLYFNKVAGLRSTTLLKKEALALMISQEFCEISKNTFFYRTSLAASVICIYELKIY